MRIATLVAGLSLALASPALADNAATTYGPTGPLPSVLNPDQPRGIAVGAELLANDPRLEHLPTSAYSVETRSMAGAEVQVAERVDPTSGVTPGENTAEGSANVQASGTTGANGAVDGAVDVDGSVQGSADAEASVR